MCFLTVEFRTKDIGLVNLVSLIAGLYRALGYQNIADNYEYYFNADNEENAIGFHSELGAIDGLEDVVLLTPLDRKRRLESN